ncbi:MAG: serine/threonine-protein kinase, partial [Myxococcota bacterium]|nr:serine/threonine-protein kinase [Myxococcota bacterium]
MTEPAEHLTVRCSRCQKGYRDRLPGSLCDCSGGVLLDVRRSRMHKGDPLIGQIIGQSYAIFDRLGSGAMGSVYKARHVRLDRLAAIKLISATSQDDAHDDELRSRFLREAKALSNVRHDSVITVYDYGSHGEKLYMVLEFIGGQNLWQLLRDKNGLPIERALPILRQLAEAVGAIHAVKIVHRDLKPGNIMIDDSHGADRVVLIDFGIAKTLPPAGRESDMPPLTQAGLMVGTPKYMAPEQLMNGKLGPWTDIYALGVLVYRVLSGQTPFNGHQAEIAASHLRDPVPPLPSHLQLSPFDAVIRKAMNKDPAGRFKDTKQLESALIDAWVDVSGADAVKTTQPIEIVPGKRGGEATDYNTSIVTTTTESTGYTPLVDPSLGAESDTMTEAESDGSQSGWRGVIEAPVDKDLNADGSNRPSRRLWVALIVMTSAGVAYHMASGSDSTAEPAAISRTTKALGQGTIEVFTMEPPANAVKEPAATSAQLVPT